ncbi:MAG: ROK family protein [Caldiserica bacterium]|nr:ROK family protein [Caldisericota bacterium]
MMKAIGLDLGGTFIKVGLVDETGRILRKNQLPTRGEEGRNVVLAQMEKAVREILESGITGIGIGTPGIVDRKGIVYSAPNLPEWDQLNLKKHFEEKLSLPVVVENDVNTITWGEYLFGAGKGVRCMVCITLGTGVGGGVVIDGKLLRGDEYSAVELGHIPINYKGPLCKCGNRGCIERYVGAQYIAAMAKREIQRGRKSKIKEIVKGNLAEITPKVISQAYNQGDKLSEEIWITVGRYLGAFFSGIVNIFNPEIIVIGGGISQVGEILFSSIKKEIKNRSYALFSQGLQVVPATLGVEAGIVSAASLVLRSRNE